jgi:hypothetical protein
MSQVDFTQAPFSTDPFVAANSWMRGQRDVELPGKRDELVWHYYFAGIEMHT